MILEELEAVLSDRKRDLPAGSYAATLLRDRALIARKVNEEAYEVCAELTRSPRDKERIAEEASDLLFHLLVGLVDAEVPFAAVLAVLEQRRR